VADAWSASRPNQDPPHDALTCWLAVPTHFRPVGQRDIAGRPDYAGDALREVVENAGRALYATLVLEIEISPGEPPEEEVGLSTTRKQPWGAVPQVHRGVI
jgi:hypothetical protein